MKKYLGYLAVLLVFQVTTWLFLTPLLPLFATGRTGPTNNGTSTGFGPRLPLWLAWFDTPDNSLLGDDRWQANHPAGTYLNMVAWLYRNSLYGLKWTVLAYDYVPGACLVWSSGDPSVNRNNGVTGLYRCRLGDGTWQWKLVRKLVGDWGIMWNFGWQLDSFVPLGKRGMALFQFSPRFVRIK